MHSDRPSNPLRLLSASYCLKAAGTKTAGALKKTPPSSACVSNLKVGSLGETMASQFCGDDQQEDKAQKTGENRACQGEP